VSTVVAPDRYRRRRYWPVLTVVAVLLVASALLWVPMLRPTSESSGLCNAPGPPPATTAPTTRTAPSEPAVTDTAASDAVATSAPVDTAAATAASSTAQIVTSLGAYADHATLEAVRPANPSTIALQVFNASTVRGQANAVTDELRAAGFESIKDGANDPLYPAADLNCVAQIRYGPAGSAAARTVLLVTPCAQLVLDSRLDDSVDLALGGRYLYDPVSQEVRTQLQAIRDAATPPAVIEGQTAAPKPLPPIPPLPDADCTA
jgi:LytR cell envelope-related transcriptional attenuator